MTLHDRDPVLRRKLAPRTPPPATVEVPGPAAQLSRAFGRAIAAVAPLVAEETAIHHKKASLAELLDSIETDAFVTLLSGGDGSALALIDQAGFGAVIEAMTMGRLSPRSSAPRRPTPTDAALLARVIDASLRGLEPDDPLAGLSCGRPVPDHRLLPVLMDEGAYDLVALTAVVVSGNVSRPLRLMLAVPRPTDAPGASTVAEDPVHDWGEALEEAVMRAPASLRAELGRVTLPLAEVLALGVGSALNLPLSNLEEVRLAALDGSVQAIGRLGQTRGMRAVRLTGWPGGMPQAAMIDAAPPGAAAPAMADGQGNGDGDRPAFPTLSLGLPGDD
ncbi:MAG: FliM/FliN family flagellar motor switch protein [Rhodobacteraceae bacterium]|nr:FliM/FliN family flagellar motor switch protein [Paracoccaceae bacterium]